MNNHKENPHAVKTNNDGRTNGFLPNHPVKVAIKNNIVITTKIEIVNISDGLTISKNILSL